MTGETPANGVVACADWAGRVDWGVALLMAAFMTAKSSTGATV
jgi:hypothetical protein